MRDGPLPNVLGWPAFSNRVEQPYNWLLYSHLQVQGVRVEEYSPSRALSGRYDILHLHWPDRRVRDPNAAAAAARAAGLVALLAGARARGVRVVWTVHNLEAHEGPSRPWLEPRYWEALTRRVDGFISLSESGLPTIRERFAALRDTPGFAVPHGHMRGVYPDTVTRAEAREALGVPGNATVFAFTGQLRSYKGAASLVRAFRERPEPGFRLLIAGRPKPPELADELREEAAGDPRIRIDARFIPDDELQLPLRAADLVVLPYRAIFHSASAMLALSFDRPLLVPDEGGMPELAREIGPAWVRTYAGALTARELGEAARWATAAGRPERPDLDGLGWDAIARRTLDAYRAVFEDSRTTPWRKEEG